MLIALLPAHQPAGKQCDGRVTKPCSDCGNLPRMAPIIDLSGSSFHEAMAHDDYGRDEEHR